MKPFLSFRKIYQDYDSIELLIEASNGKYSGETRIYTNSDGEKLIELGNKLLGFPKSIQHQHIFELGFTDKENQQNPHINSNTAYIRIFFRCIDSLGHTAAHIKIREESWISREVSGGEANFELLFEPFQLDIFANELLRLGSGQIDVAFLNGLEQ